MKLYLSPPPPQRCHLDEATTTAVTALTDQLQDLQRKLDRRDDKCRRYRKKCKDLKSKLEEIRTEKEMLEWTCQQITVELSKQDTAREELVQLKLLHKLKELEDHIRDDIMVQDEQVTSSLGRLTSELDDDMKVGTILQNEVSALEQELADQLCTNRTLQHQHDQMVVASEAEDVLLRTRCKDLEQLLNETRNSHRLAVMELTMEFESFLYIQNRTLPVEEGARWKKLHDAKQSMDQSRNSFQRMNTPEAVMPLELMENARTENRCSRSINNHICKERQGEDMVAKVGEDPTGCKGLEVVQKQQQPVSVGDNHYEQPTTVIASKRDEILDPCRRVQLLESQYEDSAEPRSKLGTDFRDNKARGHPSSLLDHATIPSTRQLPLQDPEQPRPRQRQPQEPVVVESTTSTNRVMKSTAILTSSGFFCRHGINPIFYR